jgi:RNA polymerase sigma-70 factor (ECF subfamily)
MRNLTLADVERLESAADATDVTFDMDEEAFRAFYDRTARALWTYLARVTASPHVADDLLQEAYYRLLRVRRPFESEAHRRAYLFRIATNLVHDGRRRAGHNPTVALGDMDPAEDRDLAEATVRRADLRRAMSHLRSRDRALLWLAYGMGQAHAEIADTLGLKTGSVKLLLFRARRKLAGLLRQADDSRPNEDNRGNR